MKKFLPRPLIFLLITFFALAAFYSLIIPLFEGPDEDDHFRLAKFIADTHALPVQLFEPGGGAAGHQGWQPPLYYSLVAALITPIDTSDYSQHLWRNYAATFVGDPACCGRNIYYHTASENFPFTRTTLAVHLARLLSILFGAVTVWATYKLTVTVLHNSPRAARDLLPLAAAAVVAFNPSFLFASALVSNDAPLAAFSALVLLLWVKLLVDQNAPTLKSAALLGALLGLALLMKTTAVGLVPLSVLVLLLVARRERNWRYAILGNAVMLAVIALLAGWWFVRNQLLYGDPLALRLVAVASLFPRAGPLTLPELFSISLPWMWQTFWGGPTPGDFSPVLLVALALLGALGFIGMVFVFRLSSFTTRLSLALLAAWLGFILIAQIQFIQTTVGADQGRYLFPAISAIALFFVAGLNELASLAPRPSRLAIGSLNHWLIGSFFALALFVPFAYTLPAYAHPALASESELARASHPRQVNFDNLIELRGYDLGARTVKQGETLRVTLYWRALAPMSESYRVFVHLVGQDNRVAGGTDVIPARGAFPTIYWQPGDIVRDDVQIPVAANALPGKYTIEVGLYPVGQPSARLATIGSDDDRALLDAVKVAAREPVAYAPQTLIGANFAGKAKLIGYDVTDLAPSQGLGLTLYWQALAPLDRDYTVFVHALDASGKIVAQTDRQPQAGNYPTSIWDVGEQIRDEYVLSLPPGNYRIEIGLYRADTGERLPVSGEDSKQDHVEFVLGATR
ncbi:MAG TPA: glycosyltransferase family 39 protein [Anaerolineae bacterium]